MTIPFEERVESELLALLQARVPPRAVQLTVRELVVTRLERGPLGAREVRAVVEAVMRAAGDLVRRAGAPEDLVETVGRAAIEGVRGHGGETMRWLPVANRAVVLVLDELARDVTAETQWRGMARQIFNW